MAQVSIWWPTDGVGDGTAGGYSSAKVFEWLRDTFLYDHTKMGPWTKSIAYPTPFAVSAGSGKVTVAPGAGLCYGSPFRSTANEDVTIPTPSANPRIDLVVLRAAWTADPGGITQPAQTVRIIRLPGAEAASPTPPDYLDFQSAGTQWAVPLAEAHVTTGGVITPTDKRVFIEPPFLIGHLEQIEDGLFTADAAGRAKFADGLMDAAKLAASAVTDVKIAANAVTAAKIAADAVDDTKVGNRVPQFYRRQGSHASDWTIAGTTTYTPTTVRMQAGAVQVSPIGGFAVTFPTAFSGKPLVFVEAENYVLLACLTSTSATGFTVQLWNVAAGVESAGGVHWFAVGPE